MLQKKIGQKKRKKRRKQSEVKIFTNRDKFGTLAASPIVPALGNCYNEVAI